MFNFRVFLIIVAAAICAGTGVAAGEIRVPSVLLRAIEQVEVPAREAGVLAAVPAREGQNVLRGGLLAQIEDALARVALTRAMFEVEMAFLDAENDVSVRFARKSLEVAKAEFRRATVSIEQYPKSVSPSELDHLRLTVERTALEIEQAEHKLELAKTNRDLRQSEVQAAELGVERRKIVAPTAGVVAQIYRRPGEWVQPGDRVMRLLRIDRLRAEGFVNIEALRSDILGRPVTISVILQGDAETQFPGKIIFVSPETDPVNGQVRIWAELENRDLRLRPGMQGAMTIDTTSTENDDR